MAQRGRFLGSGGEEIRRQAVIGDRPDAGLPSGLDDPARIRRGYSRRLNAELTHRPARDAIVLAEDGAKDILGLDDWFLSPLGFPEGLGENRLRSIRNLIHGHLAASLGRSEGRLTAYG
jgi:hypothetical protein